MSTPVIVLSGEIDSDSADLFNWELRQARSSKGVEIRIDSPGGSVTSMNRMLDAMRTFGGRIKTVVTGTCASAAACVFLTGHRREIVEGGILMIHNARVASSGKETAGTRETSSLIADLIALRTGVPKHQVSDWMRGEQYFDAKFALRWRMAHGLAPANLTTSYPDLSQCTVPVVSEKTRNSFAYRMHELDSRYEQLMNPRQERATSQTLAESRLREVQLKMDDIDRRMRALKRRPAAVRADRRQPIVLPAGMMEKLRTMQERATAAAGKGWIGQPFGFAR